MEVEFSEVYEPLFELLEAWNDLDRYAKTGTTEIEYKRYLDLKHLIQKEPNQQIKEDLIQERKNLIYKGVPKEDLKDLDYRYQLSEVDTVLMSGGRDSGKTFSLSTFNPVAAKDYNHRILYTRQTMSSTDNSITEALENRLEMLGIDGYFECANKTYSVTDGKGKISITGQKTSVGTQTAKLKSLEDYSIFETDEGEELESYESWKKVKRSIRASDVQCLSIISFNPPTRAHWIFEEFYEDFYDELQDVSEINGIRGKTLYIHSTYLDNIDNMAEHNLKEYEELRKVYEYYESLGNEERDLCSPKIKKQWKQYKFEILGGFKDVADGVIYEDWEIGEFNDSLPYCYGIDFGSNDPDAIVKVAVDHNEMKIYLDEIHFMNGQGSAQLMEHIHNKVGFTDLIIGDSNAKRTIQDLYNGMHGTDGTWLRGVNIRKVRKSKGAKNDFVSRTIKIIRSYTLVVTPDSKNLQKALKNYVWHDSRAGVPKHDWSDLNDAWRYGALEFIVY